jgi:hypothetical protein
VGEKSIFTEGNKGNEAPNVGLRQISKLALSLPLRTEIPTAFRYLLLKQTGIESP